MYCFVILLLFNKMQMSVRRFSAIPHLRGKMKQFDEWFFGCSKRAPFAVGYKFDCL